jgi:hypothetical protein
VPAIAFSATGRDHRTWAVSQQPLDLDIALNAVKPQLDQFNPLLRKMPQLGKQIPMPAAGNADADHRYVSRR